VNSLLLLPLKSRSGAVQILFCGFLDCIIENRSNAELYLLLPEQRGEKCRKWSGSLGVGSDVSVGGDDDVADAFGDGVGDIRLSKNTEGARRLVYVATAKSSRASSRSSLKKKRRQIQTVVIADIAK